MILAFVQKGEMRHLFSHGLQTVAYLRNGGIAVEVECFV
jgi:hypothetical protein